jgi:predicted DNA-binding transcriptional regulator AlpA
VDSAELEQTLSMSRNRLKKHIWADRWDRVPKPVGKVGQQQWYWRRHAVEEWLKEH